MIKISWRFGVVQREKKTGRVNDPNKAEWIEQWFGIDAASGLNEEQFFEQMSRIGQKIDQTVIHRGQELELHIRFSAEISGKN